jgi:uncharacterized membrane protein YeaQ/YmgE (transglycosylase-associated protein family)
MNWLLILIGGAILGLLGRLIAPGDKDNVPTWLTIIVGIVGAILGYVIASQLGVAETKGIDWIQILISLVVSIVLVMITSVLLARRGRSSTTV